MLTLRLTAVAEGSDQHRVELALEGDGARQTAISRFKFGLSEQDREDVRWYLEDFLQYPLDPAPRIAARIEGRMAEIGRELFQGVFHSNDSARDLWAALRSKLSDARVEIVTGVEEATTLPWELLHDPKTDAKLALVAQSFVRAHPQAAERPRLPQASPGPIWMLLVICRPRGGDDVPFRSVANRLLKGLSGAHQDRLRLDLLRPSTFEQLSHVLRDAKARGEPYHVVHFDGHGTYSEGGPRPGAHGYLLFENPALQANRELVDGPRLGSLLAEAEVPVLVLNACRSAHANPPPEPIIASRSVDDSHAKVRALGSLAHEIMDAGATAVVAMRYNVFVETAAQFMADLYGPLSQGYTVGEAVTLGRKQLAAQPLRQIGFDPTPLQDWTVPVVFEAAPVTLFPRETGVPRLRITLGRGEAMPARGKLDPNLPARPDAGFFGRDETLLALDRAFDTQPIVLLHAWAGSGKTATAAEFARWYALTGGVEGPVLFSSFEQYKPLARVLDGFGSVFQKSLENAGVHWLALGDANRCAVALEVMQQVPVLWIWDNVEPVAGFPAGTPSKWSAEEQKELADFLRAARDTKAKFLLTSRRDEHGWLRELPTPVLVPPMPFQERVQLARALAEKRGRRLTDIEDWRPLLEFTQGNPITITVLVGQALRDGLKTETEIHRYLTDLRSGESAFRDEPAEGRAASLGASLSYGFEHAFSEEDRRLLSLLHLFQGYVNSNVLLVMCKGRHDWALSQLRGLSEATISSILDRAAEIGLLTARGGGHYNIHPAVPWFLRRLFERHWPEDAPPESRNAMLPAARAFVEAMSYFGHGFLSIYELGGRRDLGHLLDEEANFLNAISLSLAHEWWRPVVGCLEGLFPLYQQTGRRGEWSRLFGRVVLYFLDDSDKPLPGREPYWSIFMDYRVRLAMEAQNWLEAERLAGAIVDNERPLAVPLLNLQRESLDGQQRAVIRGFATALGRLGDIRRERQDPRCLEAYRESIQLYQHIDEKGGEAARCFNLGHAYKNVHAIQDLDEAERCYRRSLGLRPPHDNLSRAQCLAQLGALALRRLENAIPTGSSDESLGALFEAAIDFYQQALAILPPDALDGIATIHNQLGAVYFHSPSHLNLGIEQLKEALRCYEAIGDRYMAGGVKNNLAGILLRIGRLADARDFAQSAIATLRSCPIPPAELIRSAESCLREAEGLLRLEVSPPEAEHL